VEEGCPTGAVPFRSCRSCPSPCFPCLEDVCMVSLGKLLAERCMLLLSLEKLPCGEGDVLLWLERRCCSATFAAGLLLLALKGGTRKGRQEGEVLPINFASCYSAAFVSCCPAAFAAGLVPHVCCIVVEKNLSK
jgi:hypothetical protein